MGERYANQTAGMFGLYVAPPAECIAACVVIGGSVGGMATSRLLSERLAASGIASLALAYHGIDGRRPTLRDVPLEGFADAAKWLGAQACPSSEQVALMGLSRGSEAAMLVAARFDDACGPVVGVVPSNVVCGSWPPGAAAWLFEGKALPCVDRFGPQCDDPAAYIPVEVISSLLLVSAGKDEVWPSHAMSDAIVARRARHGRHTEHVHLPDAGHKALQAPLIGDREQGLQHPDATWTTITGFLADADRA